MSNSKAKNTSSNSTSENILMFAKKQQSITFAKFSLCGLEMDTLTIREDYIAVISEELVKQGLLNKEDDVLKEMGCPFYKQMVHGVVIEMLKREQSAFKLAS